MRRVEVREGEDLLKCVEYEKKVKNIARHLFTYFFGTFSPEEHFHSIYYHSCKYIDASFIAGMWIYLHKSMPITIGRST